MKTVLVAKRELHLAAYMKANGAKLICFDHSQGFSFQTGRSVTDWRVEHSNSCCARIDNEMLALKRMAR